MRRIMFAAAPLTIALLVGGSVVASASEYVVQPGDSLWAISSSRHLGLQGLIQSNHLERPDRIYPGERLELPDAAPALYVVQPGDSIWSIAARQHVDREWLIRSNGLQHPERIYPGQRLRLGTGAEPATADHSLRGPAARAIIEAAARRHGLNPRFALAVGYWESGWNQSALSATGAVGLMQIEPYTADWAGPSLLGRRVDIHDPADNADLGTALLRHYLDVFSDPKLALAAYYQGEAGTKKHGIYPSSHTYVDGIWKLRNRFQEEGL